MTPRVSQAGLRGVRLPPSPHAWHLARLEATRAVQSGSRPASAVVRAQADLRRGLALRPHRGRLIARSDWPYRKDGRRCEIDASMLFVGIDDGVRPSLPDSFFENKVQIRRVLGVPRAFLRAGIEPDMLSSFEQHTESTFLTWLLDRRCRIACLGLRARGVLIINPAEVSTNLARFDGVRYGLSILSLRLSGKHTKRPARPDLVRRHGGEFLVGTFVLSAGYADAYYRKAREVRELIRADFARAFQLVDAIVLPVSPVLPWKFGEKSDPLAMYAADIFHRPVNLAGVPAQRSRPALWSARVNKTSRRIQLIAPHGGEDTLFSIGDTSVGTPVGSRVSAVGRYEECHVPTSTCGRGT